MPPPTPVYHTHTCIIHTSCILRPLTPAQATSCKATTALEKTYQSRPTELRHQSFAFEFQQLWCGWKLEERFGMMNSQAGPVLATTPRFKKRKLLGWVSWVDLCLLPIFVKVLTLQYLTTWPYFERPQVKLYPGHLMAIHPCLCRWLSAASGCRVPSGPATPVA